MTNFHVDSVALDGATVQIGTTIDRISSDISTMNGQLRALDGSWTGPAAIAFGELMTDWTVASVRLTESLTAIGTALRQIHSHYLETEATNVRLLGG
jgi:WXG100 family type VII secretion target